VVHAQTQEPASKPDSSLEFFGYFDFYYQNSPQAHLNPVSGNSRVLEGRVFDRLQNQFVLNMAELSVRKSVGDLGFRLDLAFGEMVDAMAANGLGSPVGSPTGNQGANEPTRNITQATITYRPIEGLSVAVGKFYTHMGYELTKAKENWQYSRSFGFSYGIPFWHQGVSISYSAIPQRLTGTLHVVNGWDARIAAEANASPTVGANINIVPIDGLTLNYNYIGGTEQTASDARRDVHEMNLNYSLTERLSFAADYLAGTEQNVVPYVGAASLGQAKWSSVAGYFQAKILSWYALSGRYEIFDDADGWALSGLSTRPTAPEFVDAQKINSITLTNTFHITDGLESRIELRSDKSNRQGYFRSRNGDPADRQDSYTLAFLYSF